MSKRPITFINPGRYEIYCHHSSPTFYPEESHATVQVCIPLKNARYSVARQSETGEALLHNLGARDVLVLPIGQPHAVNWRRPADIVSLQLSETFITEALEVPRLHLQDTITLRDPFISAIAVQIRSALSNEGKISSAFADAMATAIAYRIGIGASNARVRGTKSVSELSIHQLARVERFIDERLDQQTTLTELAELLGLSKWHFMRRFSASRGLTPHDFITNRRIARAKELLSDSNIPITSIALEVGMSHSHFSRMFLSRVGVSPSEYRRQKTA